MNFFDVTVSEENDDCIAELEVLTFRLPLAQAVAIDEWDWHLEDLRSAFIQRTSTVL